MSKIKTTKKNISEGYAHIISLGYCQAQFLLWYSEPIAYSTHAEGWACDYYDVDGVLISTGYSPVKPKNTKKDYSLVASYDNQARKIVEDYSLDHEERKKKVQELLLQFVEETII